MKCKYIITVLLFCTSFSISCISQESKPELLHKPESWRFERMDFPLDFAPELKYSGFEELRFAPGMFDTLSHTYFTYLFAIIINDKSTFSFQELETFLLSYYKGLCYAVAKSNKLSVDISKIKVKIEAVKAEKESQNYNGQILFFDVFNDGREVVLNIELEIINQIDQNKLYIIALVSPQKRQAGIWNELKEIRTQIKL